METHSSSLAWRIPWTEEPGGLQSVGRKGLDSTEQLNIYNNRDARGGELRALVLLGPLSVRNRAYMPCGAFHAPALPHLTLAEGAS